MLEKAQLHIEDNQILLCDYLPSSQETAMEASEMTRDPLLNRKDSDDKRADRIDRSVKKLLAMNHMKIRRLDSNTFNNRRRKYDPLSPITGIILRIQARHLKRKSQTL